MSKHKLDYVRIKVLRKDGVVQNKWVTPKKFKSMEAVFFHHKNKLITAFVPGFKISKKQPISKFPKLMGNKSPKRITLHIKIIYDKSTSSRYLANSRRFYLEGMITTECLADEIHNKIPVLERFLKDKIQSKFFSADSRGKLLSYPYYDLDEDKFQSGVEVEDIPFEPSSSISASANYRYSPDSMYKETDL